MAISLQSVHSEVWIKTIVVGIITTVGVTALRYKAAIRNFFGKSADPFRMVRTNERLSKCPKKIQMVALNPDFQAFHNNDTSSSWKFIDLGDYLSSLRPSFMSNSQFPQCIEEEIQAIIARALLKHLGPLFGAALLPFLGTSTARNFNSFLANKITTFSTMVESKRQESAEKDQGGLPLSLYAITYAAELNYQRLNRNKKIIKEEESEKQAQVPTTRKTPLDLLRAGEVGYKPTFDATLRIGTEENTPLIPNPFVLTQDWTKTIQHMEDLIQSAAAEQEYHWKETPNQEHKKGSTTASTASVYDPDSRAMKLPVPIHERLLPDLHLGWGDAKCTHTQREILHNRLLAVLLNRLASNYFQQIDVESSQDDDKKNDDSALFKVVVSEENDQSSNNYITKPADLIYALMHSGHAIEARICTQITTFGVALCVKETSDNSSTMTSTDSNDKTTVTKWSNIPLAYFLQNGFTDASGRDAFTCLPHSGLNLEVRDGPIIKKASIQHYMSIEGMCGWNSNHNADVPWIRPVTSGTTWREANDVAEVVRVAALQSVVLNGVATRFDLPMGGYGLTGVCNDSAASIQYAMLKTTHIYPLTMNGRFAMKSLRFARELREVLQKGRVTQQEGGTQQEEKDVVSLKRLIDAMQTLRSDNNSMPSEAEDQCRRLLICLNAEDELPPFGLIKQTKQVIQSIHQELAQVNVCA